MQIDFSAADGTRMAAWDFIQGLLNWRLWAYLGVQDIRQRYRRSSFGPLWLALGLGVTILGIGILYSQILKTSPGNFVPFVAISLLVWNFVSSMINESAFLFNAGVGLMLSSRVPYTSFVLRGLVRNLMVAAHCLVPVVIAFLFYRYPVHWVGLVAIPGLILLIANMYWISLCLGILCLRFRDVAQIVIYLTQLALFVTPIIWMPTQIRPGSPYVALNPLNHLLNLVRAPIFFGIVPTESFVFCLAMLGAGGFLTFFVMVRFRRSLAFWI